MGIRITPDGNDIVVWRLDETTTPFVNSSTSGASPGSSANLTTLSGTVQVQQPSPFAATGTNSAIRFTGNNSGAPRNFVSGANTFQPQSPVTFSVWIFIRAYNTTGAVQHIFAKQHTAGTWAGATTGQILLQNHAVGSTTFDLFAVTTSGGGPTFTIPINMWCHVGLAYDGSFQYGYLNGNLIGQTAATGTINYGGGGPWFFGAIPSGGSPDESVISVCDFRAANVVRPQSYFQNIYRKGGTSSGLGIPLITYYKLRAFDLSCSTPTPSYWVSTTIDYTGAPSTPCGGSYGPIEVLDSWSILG